MNCLNCNKPTNRKKYCNLECSQKFRSKTKSEYRKHRKSKCEYCPRKTQLHVHHLDENPANNNPDNLVTLCKRHHEEIHSHGSIASKTGNPRGKYMVEKIRKDIVKKLRKYERENKLRSSISKTIEHLLEKAWKEKSI